MPARTAGVPPSPVSRHSRSSKLPSACNWLTTTLPRLCNGDLSPSWSATTRPPTPNTKPRSTLCPTRLTSGNCVPRPWTDFLSLSWAWPNCGSRMDAGRMRKKRLASYCSRNTIRTTNRPNVCLRDWNLPTTSTRRSLPASSRRSRRSKHFSTKPKDFTTRLASTKQPPNTRQCSALIATTSPPAAVWSRSAWRNPRCATTRTTTFVLP